MATYEQNALITVKDESGNKYLLYPVTKMECVEGLPDLTAGANGQALAKIAGAMGWKSFAETSHSHSAADVGAVPTTRKVNGKALSTDVTLAAADVGARPSTWTPTATDVGARASSWTPTWSEVQSKPTTFAPTAHTHAPADLTSAVPLTKGGTGATTAAAARAALAALAAFPPTPITISATWSGTGPWTQSIEVAGVLAAWDWRLGLYLAKITDDAARKLQEKAYGCITWCDTYDGGITLTCRDKKPDVAISAVLAGEV